MKIKAAVSKNLLIFLKKCLTHDVTLKAFRIKPPIKLQKKHSYHQGVSKNLLLLAKSNAKQRLRNYNIKVNDLSQELRSVLSDAYLKTIECITNISKEKENVKKRNHLIEKYQNLIKGNKMQNNKTKLFLTLQPKRSINIIRNF